MSTPRIDYPLGNSAQELRRLALQAEILRPMTQRVFREAGIMPGMRVLDLGAGAGDVCVLLSEMVGPEGAVVGLDRDADTVMHAAERVQAAGYRNITFLQSDIVSYVADEPFDALVGRCVLLYQPDPSATVSAALRNLRPGSVVAFIEPVMFPSPGPDSLIQRAGAFIFEAFRRSGAHMDLGLRLHSVFEKAGLPQPNMCFEMAVDPKQDSILFQYIADTYASLLPKGVEYGMSEPQGIDLAALPGLIAAEMKARGHAMIGAPMVAAWCRTSP